MVRILSNENAAKAFINTQADYNDLLKTLTNNDMNFNISLINLKKIGKTIDYGKIEEMAVKIVKAIESQRNFVQIDERKSFYEIFLSWGRFLKNKFNFRRTQKLHLKVC